MPQKEESDRDSDTYSQASYFKTKEDIKSSMATPKQSSRDLKRIDKFGEL